MSDCLFCKIRDGELPTEIVWQDDQALAFRDLHPQAPTHILVIPRQHITSLAAAKKPDAALLGHLQFSVAEVARLSGVAESGYRVVCNSGTQGGQTVLHLHLHVLGGRAMNWPPG